MSVKVFVVISVGILAGMALSVAVASKRFDKIQATVGDPQILSIEVFGGAKRHVYFEKDRMGRRAERVVFVDADPQVATTTYFFFFFPERAGYDVFVERSDAPQARERVDKIPTDVERFWRTGQKFAEVREPALFDDGF